MRGRLLPLSTTHMWPPRAEGRQNAYRRKAAGLTDWLGSMH